MKTTARSSLKMPAFAGLVAALLLAGPGHQALGQSSYTWNGGGGDNNWSTGGNWGGSAPSSPQAFLNFAGSTRTTSNNTFADWSAGYRIYFNSGASSFTLNGAAVKFYDYGGAQALIENDSSNLQTVSFTFAAGNSFGISLNANTGSLAFNGTAVYLDGNSTLTTNANSGRTITISNAIQNAGGNLYVTGAGSTILTGNNTYTGTTTINSGTLQLGDGTTGRDGSIAGTSIVDNANLTYNLFGNSDYSGVISGTGSVTKIGNAALTLSGTSANTYTGTTTVSGGATSYLNLSKTDGVNAIAGNLTIGVGSSAGFVQLMASNQIADTSIVSMDGNATNARGVLRLNGFNETIGGLSSLITGGGVVDNNGATNSTLTLNVASGSQNFSGQIRNQSTGTLALIKTGAGTQIISSLSPVGNNTYSGGTQINGGILQVGSANALGSSTNTGNITFGGGTLQYSANGTGTDYSARFKNSASAITLDTNGQNVTLANATDSTNTGGLTKDGNGTLTLSGTNTYTGTTTVASGTLALTGSGSLANGASGSRVNVSSGGIFDISGVTTGATVSMLSETGTSNGGSVKLGSKALTVNGGAASTVYHFNTLGLSGDTGSLTLNAANASTSLRLYGASLYTGATTIQSGTLGIVSTTASSGYSLTGGSLTTESAANLSDAATVDITSGTFTVGASDTIGAISGSGGTIAIGSGLTLTTNTAGSTTLAGQITGATGALTKSGSGTLALSGNNTYSGSTTITSGKLQFSGTGNANSSTILLGDTSGSSNATLDLNGVNQTYGSAITVQAGSTGVLTINSLNASGTNTLSNTITLNAAATLSAAGGGTLSVNTITGVSTANTLTINGPGTVNLGGSVDNTNLSIAATSGTLILAKSNSGPGGSGAGVRSLGGTLTIAGATVQLGGTGQGGSTTSVDQIYDNASVVLNSGAFDLNGRSETIGGFSGTGGTVTSSAAGNATLTVGGSGTFSGVIQNGSGTVSFTKMGNNTTTFNGALANTYTGTTTITGGTVVLNKTAGVNAIAGNITLGDGTGADVLQLLASNQIADTSIITLAGTGVGNRGWLQLYGKDETIGGLSSATAGAGLVANEHSTANSTLTLNVTGSQDFSGLIRNANSANGTLSLVKTGGGTQILSGTNTYNGTTTISTGTLQIGNGGTSGALSANSTITNNGILVFNRSDTVTAGTDFSGSPISGSGSIVQNGSGKLLLWSGNTFTGGVTVNSGTLGIWEGSSLGAIPGTPTTQLTFGGNSTLQFEQTPTALPLNANRLISINPGVTATIDTQSYSPSIAGVISGATGALAKIGSGNLTLNGNNTYGGGTSVTAGTLTLGNARALGSTTAALAVNAATLNMNTFGATIGPLTSSNGTFSGFNLGGSGNTLAASSATLSGTTYIGIIGSSITDTGTSNVITSSGGGLTGTVQFAGAQNLSVPVSSLIVKNGSGTFYRATLNSTDTAAQVIITGSVPSNVLSVMPLGASIMAGTSAQNPYDGGGFHAEMYQNLVNDGRFTPDFVGSSTNLYAINPTGPNILTSAGQTNSEGHPGYTTSQILNNLNANDGTGGNNGGYWLAPGNGVNPNYIPLNAGGNDFAQNHTDAQAINRYDAIISQLNTLRAGVDTLASNLMYRSDVGSYINTYFNPYVQGIVYNHVLAGQNVQFVDLYGLLTPNNSTYPDNPYISSDRVHPNQAGYNRMGDIMYSSTVHGAAYWTGSQGGNWSTLNGTSTNWAMDSALTTDRQALLTDAAANTYSYADVFFNGNASPLATTLGADTTVRSLNFAAGATGAVTVGGNSTLTIGSGGITVQQGTGAHTVSSNIALASDQTWGNVSSNNLTVSGVVSGSGNLTVGGSYTVYTGNSSSTITPTTVTGTGAFILSGNNTYTGATAVTGGTLVVNGRLASPSVTVGAAGTLGGNGTITGDTTIAGTHTPGNSPGIQTFAGSLTYSGGLSAVNWELAANSTTNAPNPNAIFDTVVVAGNLSFNGLTDLNLSFKPVGGNVIWSDPFWQTSKSGTGGWLVYDVTGAITNIENLNLVTTNWLDSGSSPFNSVLGGSYFSLYQSVSGKQIYLNYTFSTVTTPEPSSGVAMAVVAILGGAVFFVRRNGRAYLRNV